MLYNQLVEYATRGIIMSLKHGLLGLLNYEPMTGYDLDKMFKESLGYFWHAKASQIYRELDAMEQNGWLTSERVIQDEKPNKRVYSITAEGKAEFLDWLSLPKSDIKNAMQQKNALLMRVFFGGEAKKEQTLELLRSFREEWLAYIQEMDRVRAVIAQEAPDSDPEQVIHWEITVLHGEIVNRARLEWVEKSIAMLENME